MCYQCAVDSPYESYDRECDYAEKLRTKLEHVQEHFRDVLDIIYGYAKFDKMKLENALDEVSSAVGYNLSPTDEIKLAV